MIGTISHLSLRSDMPLPEVGFKEITIDFLQARFWITSE
jgi:hypothetical protein